MLLQVHRLSYKVLYKTHGSALVPVDRSSALLPVLIAAPRRGTARLTHQVELTGPDTVLRDIHPDAGHNLQALHMQQLMDWITLHVEMGQMAWPAMMDYYRLYDLQDEDYDPASAYRMWHRAQNHKKSKKMEYLSRFHVSKNIPRNPAIKNDPFLKCAELIEEHSDAFYRMDGSPDAGMIRKALMYTMAHRCGWSQSDIAELFGLMQPAVSKHISGFSVVLS